MLGAARGLDTGITDASGVLLFPGGALTGAVTETALLSDPQAAVGDAITEVE